MDEISKINKNRLKRYTWDDEDVVIETAEGKEIE